MNRNSEIFSGLKLTHLSSFFLSIFFSLTNKRDALTTSKLLFGPQRYFHGHMKDFYDPFDLYIFFLQSRISWTMLSNYFLFIHHRMVTWINWLYTYIDRVPYFSFSTPSKLKMQIWQLLSFIDTLSPFWSQPSLIQ